MRQSRKFWKENWTTPRAGSIQALVRMTGDGKTRMVELIVIEEEEGTLRLRLQQWDAGYKPRTPGPQVMKLIDLGENTVAFKSETEGDIAELRYTRWRQLHGEHRHRGRLGVRSAVEGALTCTSERQAAARSLAWSGGT